MLYAAKLQEHVRLLEAFQETLKKRRKLMDDAAQFPHDDTKQWLKNQESVDQQIAQDELSVLQAQLRQNEIEQNTIGQQFAMLSDVVTRTKSVDRIRLQVEFLLPVLLAGFALVMCIRYFLVNLT